MIAARIYTMEKNKLRTCCENNRDFWLFLDRNYFRIPRTAIRSEFRPVMMVETFSGMYGTGTEYLYAAATSTDA
jgi:hypothetical protein